MGPANMGDFKAGSSSFAITSTSRVVGKVWASLCWLHFFACINGPVPSAVPERLARFCMSKSFRHITSAVSGLALTAFLAVYIQDSYRQKHSLYEKTVYKMGAEHSFRTLFAVPMTCDGCVKDVSDTLYKMSGISKVEADLKEQLVTIEGTAPPSAIVQALQSSGRDAILRGSGTSNGECRVDAIQHTTVALVGEASGMLANGSYDLGAAVSILETYYRPAVQEAVAGDNKDRLVRGLVRLVQVSSSVTLIDLTVMGLAPGIYQATIRAFGDLNDGALSTGPIWLEESSGTTRSNGMAQRGALGTVVVGQDGRGAAFVEQPFQVWEVIGHALVVSPQETSKHGTEVRNDENTVAGVIARSAGVWDNVKTVCSCSGKTLWDERKEEVKKGML